MLLSVTIVCSPCCAIYYNFFTHSPVDGHLGGFQSGTVMNEAGMNILSHVFRWHLYSLLVGVYLGLDHSAIGCVCMLSFTRYDQRAAEVLAPIYRSPNCM